MNDARVRIESGRMRGVDIEVDVETIMDAERFATYLSELDEGAKITTELIRRSYEAFEWEPVR